jgi:hypothetical protein
MSATPDPSLSRPPGVTGFPPDRLPRKRLFIGLVTGTSILLCLLLLLGWIIPVVGFGNIHASVPYITGILLVAIIATIAWGSLSLVLQIAFGRPVWGSQRVRALTIRLLLPLMEGLAVLFGISRDEVRRSFIKVNNQLTLSRHERLPPERVLILLPHCIQRADCLVRLSYSVDACKRCGRCPLSGLLALRDRYGVGLAVATGGSIARRIVVETKPALIVAVACERDLTAGIQDTHPLPVFGLLNQRPEGPCRNTLLDLGHLASILDRFVALPPVAGPDPGSGNLRPARQRLEGNAKETPGGPNTVFIGAPPLPGEFEGAEPSQIKMRSGPWQNPLSPA